MNEAAPDPPTAGQSVTRPFSVGRVGWVVGTVASALVAVLFGFLLFAAQAMRPPAPIVGTVDGILVLTGGEHRIGEGARLLRQNVGRRMLISGVNPQTSRDDVIRLSGLDPSRFNCCVDLGYAAQDTIGNAEEARTWAAGIRARRLVIVTSNYHMPRSLTELAIALPGVELVAHPVMAKVSRDRAWWLQPGLARLLATEYIKFLPVAARYGLSRHLTTAKADSPAVRDTARAGGE